MVCLVYNYLRSVRYFLFGAVVVVSVWWLNIQLTVQSAHITTKVVSSNTAHGALHWMQQYVIKFVSDLRQVDGFFSGYSGFPPPIKLIATIQLKYC